MDKGTQFQVSTLTDSECKTRGVVGHRAQLNGQVFIIKDGEVHCPWHNDGIHEVMKAVNPDYDKNEDGSRANHLCG